MRSDLHERLINKDDYGYSEKFDFKQIFCNDYSSSGREAENYFKEKCINVEHLAHALRTDLGTGLDTTNKEDMEWRERLWGNNHLPPDEPNKIFDHIKECLKDRTLQILIFASIISLIVGTCRNGLAGGWLEGASIIVSVFIVVGITSTMNHKEKAQFIQLNRELKKKMVLVKRNKIEQEISSEKLLVGDILIIRLGDIMAVDGIIFGDGIVKMNESEILPGEGLVTKTADFEKGKNEPYRCPFVFSGSMCEDGRAEMLVVQVGENTFESENLNSPTEEDEDEIDDDDEDDSNTNPELTPLKKKLRKLANKIGNFGYIMAIVIGILLITKDFIIRITTNMPLFDSNTIEVFVNAFIITVTVILVGIPEGLPMAATLALAFSVDDMKLSKVLVKHLDKSEAMGNVNSVCTDKTGTLTEGNTTISNIFIEGIDYNIESQSIQDLRLKDLIFNCMWKNISVIESKDSKGKHKLNGDMTEKAIYSYLQKVGYSLSGNRKGEYVLPFNSDNKYMMTVYRTTDAYVLYAKGAPEKLSELFGKYLVGQEKEERFSRFSEALLKKQQEYSNSGKTTLAFGYKKIDVYAFEEAIRNNPKKDLNFFKKLSKDLVFAFLIGIKDQKRPEVPKAIQACKTAGITVRMVSGDNINTSIAVAKSVGILHQSEVQEAKRIAELYRKKAKAGSSEFGINEFVNISNNSTNENPIALDGEIFRAACGGITKIYNKQTKTKSIVLNNKRAFIHTVKKLRVISRASPEDKFLLVFGLQQIGNIVAVTGDGTNDAQALSQAHIGFAMGIRGSDICKDSADVILLDDSFGSIVTACKYGRNIYDSIRKFIQFQLTTNIVAIFISFLGSIILKDSALNAIELLWINLIMDSFASLALATEKPNDDLLTRLPYNRDGDIITPMMYMNILSQSIFQIMVLTIIIFYGDKLFGVNSDRDLSHFEWPAGYGYHFTIFYDIFVFMQVFNSLNARKLRVDEYNVFKGVFDNFYYIFIQSFIVVVQICIVTFGGRAVRTRPLSLAMHLKCAAVASLTLVLGFLIKFLPVNTEEKASYGEDQDKPVEKDDDIYSGFGYKSRGGMKLYEAMLSKKNKRKTYNY